MTRIPARPLLAALIAGLTITCPALANIEVTFVESAPKDSFTFTNTGDCALGPATLSLDLSGSSAGLIFDTTSQGAGVEVFQPYETVAGAELLSEVTQLRDGDTQISLTVTDLGPGQSVGFTIDVDDTLRHSALGQIQVTDGEIAGATVALLTTQKTVNGVFDNTSRAVLRTATCSS